MARADESQDDEPAPDQQAEVIQAVARTVWAILQSCRLNFATGELNDSLFRVVPSLVGITTGQCNQFITRSSLPGC
jgi:hypothetical protein